MRPTSAVRAGIIGTGFMASVHSRASKLVGGSVLMISGTSVKKSEAAAGELRIPHTAPTAGELIASPAVELVHICTPNATHYEYALEAIRAGKHVVCEKPLSLDDKSAAQLVEAAADAGVVATVPFVYRYHPMVREARARVARQEAGTVLTIDAAYLQDWLLLATETNWRVDSASGGRSRAFADIGSHLVDLIEFITGERISRLAARTRTVHENRAGSAGVLTEDIAAVLFETKDGVLGTLLVSQLAPGRKNALTLELHGTAKSLRFEQEHPETLWVGSRGESRLLTRDPDAQHPAEARYSSVPAGHPMGYLDAFASFMRDTHKAIAGETVDGLPTFNDGLRAVRITEAVLASAHSGEWVEVPEHS